MKIRRRARRVATATVIGAAALAAGAAASTTPGSTFSQASSPSVTTSTSDTSTTTQDLGTFTLTEPSGPTRTSTTTSTTTRRTVARRPGGTKPGPKKPAAQARPHEPAKPKPAAAQPAPLPPSPASIFGSPFGSALTFPALISQFPIPLNLLPLYQAAGIQYGVQWQVLAAINRVETNFGQDLSVSSAGAEGWMQFLPSTWAEWGMDADGDGHKNPYDPVDAIFSAARYLQAAGAARDLRGAILAYNHSASYADTVLSYARQIGGVPGPLIGALSAVNQGLFPVHAPASYVDTTAVQSGAAVQSTLTSQAAAFTDIAAPAGSPVVASEGGQVVAIGRSPALGRYIELRDAYGTTYTYGNLGSVARTYPAPVTPAGWSGGGAGLGARAGSGGAARLAGGSGDGAQSQTAILARALRSSPTAIPSLSSSAHASGAAVVAPTPKQSFVAANLHAAAAEPGGLSAALATLSPFPVPVQPATAGIPTAGLVVAPQVIASIAHAQTSGRVPLSATPTLRGTFPARGVTHSATGAPSGVPSTYANLGPRALARLVLGDRRISIYACGRTDIASGQIDPRVLATLEFLADSALDPTVTALKCGHSLYTESGNVSEHATGDAVDIAAINGIPILGHQGPGSITDVTIRRLLLLQGDMKPHQIISLMTFPGADNTLALPSHADHIHVGFRPADAFGAPLDLGSLSAPVISTAGASQPGAVVRYSPTPRSILTVAPGQAVWRPLRVGSIVTAGTVLGALLRSSRQRQADLHFTIQPASAQAPLIDPGPILDGWRLRERTPLYRGRSARPAIGQVMLMDAPALQRLVLRDRRISIYACGRADIAGGRIDNRVLDALEFLADAGLRPTVSRLACGHLPGTAGSVYADGNAVDITALNRIPVRGHQQPSSITATTIERLQALQGAMQPSGIVSLLSFPDANNTIARADHAAHIELDFAPRFGPNNALADRLGVVLQPSGGLSGTGAVAPGFGFSGGGVQAPAGTPASVAKLIAAGNAIATLPYVWGGGHASFQDTGYDCSGSVSYVLAAGGLLQAPLVSGQFESWGAAGPGRWVTIYANSDHVFLTVAGWRFDTVALAETGTRWSRTPAGTAGFIVRHSPGL